MEAKPAVLIVDDIKANLLAMEALLENLGCELVSVSSGREALQALLKREFAVMLLDVQMPQMDGYEVAMLARQNPVTSEVPIIFITAMHETEESLLRGYGSGAVDFLFKPVNPHVLRGKVQVFRDLYLGKRKLADEILSHKKTLTKLEQVNMALRHFTTAASHDLKAPLRVIQGFLEAFTEQSGARMNTEESDLIRRSLKAARRMSSLLDSLLVYAQLRKPADITEVNCEEIAEQVRTDLAERLKSSEAVFSYHKLPKVLGDAGRLYQLFMNLVSNALKFSRPDEKPRITISSVFEKGDWIFCVEDNGIGIPQDNYKTVFDAFFRLHAVSEYEGSGLGLAICKEIVEQHGGRIWVESASGRGSKFYFSLPAVS